MSTFLLVHGAWHGAWCWHKLVARLEARGHRVIAPDLPSLGRDLTPVSQVSLALWREHICRIVDGVPEKLVLVGHSRGGIVISEVAEQRPERIRALVYLTAFLLRDGECVFDLAGSDERSLVPSSMMMSDDKSSSTIREDAIRNTFYGECSDEDVALARFCLRPEPTAPLATPVKITDAKFGTVPRVYIECLRDKAMTLSMQRAMQASMPCGEVLSIDTDHSPFFSRPDELAGLLQGIEFSSAPHPQ